MEELLLTTKQAAKILKTGIHNVQKMAKEGTIAHVQWGKRKILIPREALIEQVNRMARESVSNEK